MRTVWMNNVATTPAASWQMLGRDGQEDLAYRTVGSAQALPLADSTVACIVTSPPYNCAIPNYPSEFPDAEPWPLYAAKARKAAKEMFRVAIPGCRVWLNVQATVPATPGAGIPSDLRVDLAGIWKSALEKAGFVYRDLIVWVQDSFDGAASWGSWGRPSSPNLRGSHEVILLYYKPNPESGDPAGWRRETPRAFARRGKTNERATQPAWMDDGATKTGEVDEDGKAIYRDIIGGPWTELVRNVWKIRPANDQGLWAVDQGESVKKHWPAAFPVEVPARAIRLSTWPCSDVVLDPYAGRGTTAWAALELRRRCVLVDLGYGVPKGYKDR